MTRRHRSLSPLAFLPLLVVVVLFGTLLRHPFLALFALFWMGRAVARRARREAYGEWDTPMRRSRSWAPVPEPPAARSRAQEAYLAATKAVRTSSTVDDDDRAAMLATLKEGFAAVRRLKASRARLDGDDERFHGVARDADARSRRFVEHCDSLRRSLAALEIQAQDGPALDALAETADRIAGRVQAHREIAAL